jgi:hypothetical protein
VSDLFATSSAVISPCGRYRYRLERDGYGLGKTAVIMVNPSTADAHRDDATIRKLKGFGERHKWGRIIVGNLFAYRATCVGDLATAEDPIGPDNDKHLKSIVGAVEQVIFAWGPAAKLPRWLRYRWREVDALVRATGHRPYCIGGPAQDGQPRHPLMLPYSASIGPWISPASAMSAGTAATTQIGAGLQPASAVPKADAQ